MYLSKDLKAIKVVSIDYPVRIHWISNCTCNRVLMRLIEKTTNKNEKILCVLERVWPNKRNHNRFRKFLYVKENDDESGKMLYLNSLFNSSMELRKNMINYFRNYQWLPNQSVVIRQITQTINSVCFCRENLIIDKTTSNAGFVIIGNRYQMEKISHCFNKYSKKTEFSNAYFIKLDTISNIQNKNMDHTLFRFSRSSQYDQLKKNSSLYTLVGLQSEWNPDNLNIGLATPKHHSLMDSDDSRIDESISEQLSLLDPIDIISSDSCFLSNLPGSNIKSDTVYGFPFGKREWCYDIIESSFDCAKRELYEEFNIQFSLSLWKYNESIDMPKQIYIPGFILYILYLCNDTMIGYHKESDTIYLNKI